MKKRFYVITAALITTGVIGTLSVSLQATPQEPSQNGAPQGPPPEDQGPGGRRAPDPDRQVQMMSKRLKLSADQQTQIKSILTDRVTQMEAIRNDSSLPQANRREKMRTLMSDTNSKVEAVLNDKQKTQYKQMMEERRERMRDRGGDAPPPQNQ